MKIRVAVIFGGKSAEHEISLLSAKNIIAALDKNKYQATKIFIPKSGSFNFEILKKFAVAFPILHGPYGEDGTIQGLLKLANIPFVGAGVLGSAIGMDKDVQKRLLRDTGIPTARFTVLTSSLATSHVLRALGLPVFVKPANLGSSVGVSRVNNSRQLRAAVKTALKFDRKVLIEEYIPGREIEISVLGNENPVASLPGEVIPAKKHGFYSYEAKYLDENGARLIIPAKLPGELIKNIQKLAIRTYRVLCCEGMARVDMFLTPDEKIYINEINTIPGFTNISMYPKLWEAAGTSQTKLLDKLIQLALARHAQEQKLLTARPMPSDRLA